MRFPRVLRATAFAPAPLPASLSLRSAKPPHSCRPGFELVTQPENRCVPLTRPHAPATMLGIATLALRVWASATGRPLHFAAFILRDKDSRPIFIAASDCDFAAPATCASETVPALATIADCRRRREPDSTPEPAPHSAPPASDRKNPTGCASPRRRFSVETGRDDTHLSRPMRNR